MAYKRNYASVNITETDESVVVEGQGGSIGVFAGFAKKGPTYQRTLITNSKQMIDTYGTPINTSAEFGVYGAIEYSKISPLYFTRVIGAGAYYAAGTISLVDVTSGLGLATSGTLTAAATSATYKTSVDTPTSIADLAAGANTLKIGAIGPGVYGNDIGITLETCLSATATPVPNKAGCAWSTNYDITPTYTAPTSATVGRSGYIWQQVFKLSVYVKPTNTSFTNSNATLVETFYGTIGDILSDSGDNLDIKRAINGVSKYIYVDYNASGAGSTNWFLPKPTHYSPIATTRTPSAISGGVDGSLTVANIGAAYGFYNDKNTVNVDVLVDTVAGVTSVGAAIDTAIGTRKDCIGLVQIGTPTEVQGDVSTLAAITPSITNSSYIAKYTGYDKVSDQYNNKEIYVPKTIAAAKAIAITEKDYKISLAPAGVQRGIVSCLGQLRIFTDAEIGTLYDSNVNTTKYVRGTGHVLWGQKTAYPLASALREIAVRRTLVYLENSIEPTLFGFLFEANTDGTRTRIKSLLDSFLDAEKAEENIVDFRVVCDDTNNSAQDIDTNTLNCNIYLKPVRSIEYINLNVIVTRSGISLSEG